MAQFSSYPKVAGSGTLGQQTMSASSPVVIASDQSAVHTIVDSSALPAGASTSAKQDTGNTSLASIDGKLPSNLTVTSTRLLTDGSGVTQPVSGTFWQATQPVSGTFWQATQPVSVTSLPLPTGAATETTLAAQSAKLPATLGQKAMSASLAVALASDQSAIPASQSGTWTVQPGNTANTTAWLTRQPGKISSNAPARNDYSAANVTTGAYVQLVASTTAATTEVEVFDSSGQTMAFAVGGAGSEVVQFYIFPGGNGRVPLNIPAGSSVSIRAISANATAGEIDINFYG